MKKIQNPSYEELVRREKGTKKFTTVNVTVSTRGKDGQWTTSTISVSTRVR